MFFHQNREVFSSKSMFFHQNPCFFITIEVFSSKSRFFHQNHGFFMRMNKSTQECHSKSNIPSTAQKGCLFRFAIFLFFFFFFFSFSFFPARSLSNQERSSGRRKGEIPAPGSRTLSPWPFLAPAVRGANRTTHRTKTH